MIPFQVDPSWYERYWWHDSAPRKPGLFAFFRRILSHPAYPFAAAIDRTSRRAARPPDPALTVTPALPAFLIDRGQKNDVRALE